MVKVMFPVEVMISHFPPVVLLGMLIAPVEDSVKNILSDSKVPLTFPVEVLKKSSEASHFSILISPVLLFAEILFFTITLFKVR